MMRLLHESANKEEMHALLKAKQLFTLRPTRSVKFWLRGKTYGEFFFFVYLHLYSTTGKEISNCRILWRNANGNQYTNNNICLFWFEKSKQQYITIQRLSYMNINNTYYILIDV